MPKGIKITSKLSRETLRRLRNAASRYDERDDRSTVSFTHLDRLLYAPRMPQYRDDVMPDLHDVARHMMAVAGVTFDYEVVDVNYFHGF